MKKDLDTLISQKDQFDEPSRAIIQSMRFRKAEIEDIASMKQSAGWKIINKKIREELQERFYALVKDDAKVMTLIALLKVADSKSASAILNQEIAEALPEE